MVKAYNRVDGATGDVEPAIRELAAAVNELQGGAVATQGTPAEITGLSAEELGGAVYHKTVFTFTDVEIDLTDDAGVGQWGTIPLYGFPKGLIGVFGSIIDLELTLVDDEWTDTAAGDVGAGTAAITDGAAFTGTEVNIIPSTEIAAMVDQAGPVKAKSAAGTDSMLTVDGTAAAASFNLNIRIDDNAAHITGTGTLSGTVTLVWAFIGAYAE